MHYSGMEATHFLPSENAVAFSGSVVSDRYLALAISVTIYAICGVCIFVFSVLTLTRNARNEQRGGARS